jgi:hypothetical protein
MRAASIRRMRFFVPAAKDATQAEKVLWGIREFAEQILGWTPTDRRIYSLSYRHNGREWAATVGKPLPSLGEIVVAILETETCFLVCTENRGVVRGQPVLVGRPSAISVTDFDA